MVTFAILFHDDLLSFLGGDSSGNEKDSGIEAPVKVITKPVELKGNNRIFEAVGTGKARKSAEIYPSVAEEVSEVYFEAQQMVSKGDVLVQLDDREEKLAIQLAEVKLKDAKSLLNRYEQAVKEGAVPQSEVDSARADVDSARVELDQARLALKYRKIIAPFSGVVGIPRVDPGDRVNTDTLITGLDDRKIIHVDFEVPESLVGPLKNEQTITATTPAYPGKTFTGEITALESRIDPERRTVMARASIENTDDVLRPGMSFTTIWQITGKKYPTVPEISLQWGKDGSFVWIIRDNKSQKVYAQVIARTAGNVLLDGDISESEPVVVEGLERLDDGAEVIILGNYSSESGKQVEK